MNTVVLSQTAAERICKKLNTKTGRVAVISITDPEQKPADIEVGGSIIKILRLSFYDLNRDFLSQDKKLYPAAKENDLIGLKAFVDSFKDEDIQTLIVHCGAGISRSAGLMAGIEEYLGLPSTIWNNPKYEPNHHVYHLALKEFGIERTEEEFIKIFSN